MPASAEADDIGDTSTSTVSATVPITSATSGPEAANDNPQPQGAEQSSNDGNDPVTDESIPPADIQFIEGPPAEANEPAPAVQLEAANDNDLVEPLPATGTE